MMERVHLKLTGILEVEWCTQPAERRSFQGTSRSVREWIMANAGPTFTARASAPANAGITAYRQRLLVTAGFSFHASRRWTRLVVDAPPLTRPVAKSGMA